MCRWLSATVLALALVCAALPAAAPAADGHVRIRAGELNERDGVWYLDARIDYRLSDAAREALRNGVPLQVRLDVEVLRSTWWGLWEATLVSRSHRYRLQYHALSERYVLLPLDEGEPRSFRTLDRLLETAGDIRDVTVVRVARLESGVRYTVAARAALDTDALPRPLRSMAYLSPEWQLESDWRRWPLQGS
ncbi:DUF4390 domain-containing protein [Arhodomonas aquaeolei]|uniref:DUF4390 domain-containing protein n=1 Tax=Arhodomonas aquaeolei TaxID=2369 RepID=UPI00038206CA|nr:DUF4390 domain-containing protein [Arhodomonas aquaeolei]